MVGRYFHTNRAFWWDRDVGPVCTRAGVLAIGLGKLDGSSDLFKGQECKHPPFQVHC